MTGGGSRREDRPVTDDERRYKITFITIFISLLFTRHIKTVGLADVELTIVCLCSLLCSRPQQDYNTVWMGSVQSIGHVPYRSFFVRSLQCRSTTLQTDIPCDRRHSLAGHGSFLCRQRARRVAPGEALTLPLYCRIQIEKLGVLGFQTLPDDGGDPGVDRRG